MRSDTVSASCDQFTRVAPAYDHPWSAKFFHRTHQIALDGIDVRAKRVLDVGGGTGEMARRIEGAGGTCVVVDLAAGMARVCARKGIRAVVGGSSDLPFPIHSFDVAITTNSVHHWPNVDEGVREMARAVRPGGLVVVEDFAAHGFVNGVVNALARTFETAHDHFLSVDELAGALRGAGLSDVRVRLSIGPLRLWLLVGVGRR